MMKKIVIILSILFAVIFIYANARFVNPSVQLEPIDVGTFQFNSTTEVDSSEYLSQLKKIPGIHAVSLQYAEKTIGITYEYRKLPMEQLLEAMSLQGSIEVWKQNFDVSDKPSCPVHGVLAFSERVLNALRIAD